MGELLQGGVAGEVFRVGRDGDVFFVNPHRDSLFEEVRVCDGVLSDNLGDCGAPRVVSEGMKDHRVLPYQLPEPTTVTLCFFSCAPRVAMLSRGGKASLIQGLWSRRGEVYSRRHLSISCRSKWESDWICK